MENPRTMKNPKSSKIIKNPKSSKIIKNLKPSKIIKNEINIQLEVLQKLKNLSFENSFELETSSNEKIKNILKSASKNLTNKIGFPDLIYYNEKYNLVIIIETKRDLKQHINYNFIETSNIKKYAVNGLKHYLSFFKEFNTIGIAISGESLEDNKFLINQYFKIENSNEIIEIKDKKLLNEKEYLNFFKNKKTDFLLQDFSNEIQKINTLFHNIKVKTENRPFIFGILLFSLYPTFTKSDLDFLGEKSNDILKSIQNSIEFKVNEIFKENLKQKEKVLLSISNEINFLFSEWGKTKLETLKEIVKLIKENIISKIFEHKKEKHLDISSILYSQLLKYVSGDGKVLGQVMSPNHIAEFMIKLSKLKDTSSLIDTTCGTGSFLIQGLNENDNIKVYGIEIDKHMFFLTLLNLLISNNNNNEIFLNEEKGLNYFYENNLLKDKQITNLIMNPPYLKSKELWTLILKSLTFINKRAVIILPTSNLKNNEEYKEIILQNYHVESVINMPINIFQGKGSNSASVKTSIIIINVEKENNFTYFYDLKDDGFISSKTLGRYDGLNLWNGILKNSLDDIFNKNVNKGILVENLKSSDNWNIDYFKTLKNNLVNEEKFIKYFIDLKNFILSYKSNSLLEKENKNTCLNFKWNIKSFEELKNKKYQLFSANEILNLVNHNPCERIEKYSLNGKIKYVSASNKENGTRSYKIEPLLNDVIYQNLISWNNQGDGGSGLSFYHFYNFIASSTVFLFDVKNKNFNTIKRKLFLTFLMSLEKEKRYFGNSITKKEFNSGELKILLPVNEKEEIDFNFIDKIMEEENINKIIELI